jgi:hypothetical protein
MNQAESSDNQHGVNEVLRPETNPSECNRMQPDETECNRMQHAAHSAGDGTKPFTDELVTGPAETGLTPRKWAVVRLLVKGWTIGAISNELHVSRVTLWRWRLEPAFGAAVEVLHRQAMRVIDAGQAHRRAGASGRSGRSSPPSRSNRSSAPWRARPESIDRLMAVARETRGSPSFAKALIRAARAEIQADAGAEEEAQHEAEPIVQSFTDTSAQVVD